MPTTVNQIIPTIPFAVADLGEVCNKCMLDWRQRLTVRRAIMISSCRQVRHHSSTIVVAYTPRDALASLKHPAAVLTTSVNALVQYSSDEQGNANPLDSSP